MKHLLTILVAAVSIVVAIPAEAALRVVATLPDLAAIAAAVGGDHVRVEAIAASSEDPHYVDPRPSHLVTLSRADVLIANGLGLEEGWLPPLQTQARNRSILAGGDGYIDASSLVGRIIGAEVVVDRAMGDVHPGGNPHFTFDPRAAQDIANGLAELFADLEPTHADAFEANRASFVAELESVVQAQTGRFTSLSADARNAVVYHDSLPYLLDWLSLEQVMTVEPTPGVPPDPGRVAEVVNTMRSNRVGLLAQEEFYPSNTSRRVADLAGAELVVIPGGTDFEGGETYIEHITAVADALYGALTS